MYLEGLSYYIAGRLSSPKFYLEFGAAYIDDAVWVPVPAGPKPYGMVLMVGIFYHRSRRLSSEIDLEGIRGYSSPGLDIGFGRI